LESQGLKKKIFFIIVAKEKDPKKCQFCEILPMKKIFIRIVVVITILVLIATPYLLVIDIKRFTPVVLLVWIFSLTYFLFIKKKQ
jgi:hypothetical protein